MKWDIHLATLQFGSDIQGLKMNQRFVQLIPLPPVIRRDDVKSSASEIFSTDSFDHSIT